MTQWNLTRNSRVLETTCHPTPIRFYGRALIGELLAAVPLSCFIHKKGDQRWMRDVFAVQR